MARLSESDFRGLLAFLRTSESFPDVQSFRAGTLPALRELLPCDSVAYNEVDPVRRETNWLLDPVGHEQAADKEAFERLVHQHPIVAHHSRTCNGEAVKLSDFLTRRELHRRAIYHEFFRPLEIEYQMVITVPAPGCLLLGVPFNRARRDFNERERVLVNLLRPHLVQAYRHAEARTAMRRLLAVLDDSSRKPGAGVVLLARGGGVQLATGPARAILEAYFEQTRSARLPAALHGWVRTERAKLDSAELPPPSRELVIGGAGGRLHVSYVPGSDGERDALLLEERAGPPSPRAVEALGLTRRQTQVLALVARGDTDIQVGRRLGISPRTVDKHLEHIYRALGVATRTAAVARAFQPAAANHQVPNGAPTGPMPVGRDRP
jgi:DNA-binding CsgD family transcriptional regulator